MKIFKKSDKLRHRETLFLKCKQETENCRYYITIKMKIFL